MTSISPLTRLHLSQHPLPCTTPGTNFTTCEQVSDTLKPWQDHKGVNTEETARDVLLGWMTSSLLSLRLQCWDSRCTPQHVA